eukprot:gnl/Hemi2/25901_TR8707_c0_g1_i1.p2 gnl/Hemi2/25901_TR8707_c0_g1~~gnl/Hemi2/25901_TR8707_c0_g1_i1.p2  ORF type:complete len:267 (-),score=127.29 gnl/Hemi2/25901_TR8707_c0_g1_i1:135-884(-)
MSEFEQLIGGEGVRPESEAQCRELMTGAKPVYYGCRICPFAHRAWWTAAELGYDADWVYCHIDLGSKKPAWYSQINRFETVPAMFVGGHGVYESLIIAEYINASKGGSLIPADPLQMADCRLLIAKFDDAVRGPCYQLLMNKDPAKDEALKDKLLAELGWFEGLYTELKQAGGPFFRGAELSMAEISFMPFLERFSCVLPHYRGLDLFEGGRFPNLHAALTAVRARPAFQKTTAAAEYFINAYTSYASR